MIKRNQNNLNRLNAFIDFLLVILCYRFSSRFRIFVLHGMTDNMAITRKMALSAAVYALVLLVVLAMLGFYGTTRIRKLRWKLEVLFIGVTFTVVIASALLFVLHLDRFSRGVIAIFYVTTLFVLSGKYVFSRMLLDQLRAQGFNIKHEIVIGDGPLAQQYKRDVEAEPELGIAIEKSIPLDDRESIKEALKREDIDQIVIALEAGEYQHIEQVIAECEKNGVKCLVIPFYNKIMPAHPVIENVGETKLLNMRANRLCQSYEHQKGESLREGQRQPAFDPC